MSGVGGVIGAGSSYAWGFSWRKRRLLQRFVQRWPIRAWPQRGAPARCDALYLWGSRAAPLDAPQNLPMIRVEDGFLRSVGLGADLTRPLSWVLDPVGIYYDARHPSALENILQQGVFDAQELERASALRQRIVAAGLTKYNLSRGTASGPAQPAWQRPSGVQRVVLVPGQVETDASIATGALDIRTNMDLLRVVRQARSDAWVIYKPHPDVVAGLRAAGAQEDAAAALCNEVLVDVSMHELLPLVDEVHVITSLTGFEALLRGKVVFCYGHPFYAGFGLTHDRAAHPRRTRVLSLDELVAGALLRYPVYLSRSTGQPCAPEQALDELLAWRAKSSGQPSWWQRCLRPFLARP